jgi:hypothetical protein
VTTGNLRKEYLGSIILEWIVRETGCGLDGTSSRCISSGRVWLVSAVLKLWLLVFDKMVKCPTNAVITKSSDDKRYCIPHHLVKGNVENFISGLGN